MEAFQEVRPNHIKCMEKVGTGCTAEVFRGYLITPRDQMGQAELEDWSALRANGDALLRELSTMVDSQSARPAPSDIVEAFRRHGKPNFDAGDYYEITARVEKVRQHILHATLRSGTFGGEEGFMAEVAVKQIDWNKSRMGHKEQQAFDREVAIMPKINHPNLVAFLGVSSLQRPFRIITEFCSGGCCFELLHNSDHIELTWRQTWKICNDVAVAMDYLHSYNPQIIHRDLKSLNLLLANPIRNDLDEPMVKVSDFGLSRMKDKVVEGEEVGTWGKMTIAAGTCHWMAPEVFEGNSYDEKVDVYSYSMILFETICREIPFEEEEPAQVGPLVIQNMRPDLDAVPPDTPEELRDLMIACWAKEPEKRPPFSHILQYLEHIAAKYPL